MIVGISGRINSGKDTVGKIIQIISSFPKMSAERVVQHLNKDLANNKFEIVKFADSLKDIICILLGCTREQLEDRDFKETPLPSEWWYYDLGDKIVPRWSFNKEDNYICEKRFLVKTTPRLLLQLMGTECGRNILHPNVWVNALMSKYKHRGTGEYNDQLEKILELPNWIITDMRFPNELRAVKARDGLTLRVNRPKSESHRMIIMDASTEDRSKDVVIEAKEHPSETSLDNAKFDYTIENTGTIEELVEKVKEILIKEKII